jgi:NADPH:quinone reductase-like Zn-dependent oxidoreductase
MHAAVIHDYEAGITHVRVEDRPTPTPDTGEILLKIAATPLNPSDLAFIEGRYGVRKSLPTVPGFEASGVVVAVGEGLTPESWVGRRVACFAGDGDGTWADYMLATPESCLPLVESMSDEQGAMMLVNPLTAYSLMQMAQAIGVPTVVQTAAASALGKMIVRVAQRMQIEVINVIRRDGQIAELQAVDARYILNSAEPTFDKHLREVCRQLDARLAFDAVGGELTGRILRAMPNGARIIVYGGLADAACQIGVDQLIFRRKSVEGYWLPLWMREQGAAGVARAWEQIQSWGNEFHSDIRARYRLQDVQAALRDYSAQMTGGKVLLIP